MSGALLGRGRGSRLAVYAGCVAVVVLLVFAYRAAVSEMARLRDLHDQCTIHQESLQQQLQVMYDYRVRLEKSLADETSANAAVKQELQQRATREKSRRDKDSSEALQRYNSLQQAHKTLEAEKKDLQEECDKQRQQALADSTRLETILQGLRAELKQAKDDKVQSLEHLKSKYLDINNEKSKLEERYNHLVKSSDDINTRNVHLRKEVSQLNRELENTKRACNGGISSHIAPSISSPTGDFGQSELKPSHRSEAGDGQRGIRGSQSLINLSRPPSQQQVSPPSRNENGNLPHPIQPPRDHQPIKTRNEDTLPNEAISDVGFELKGGGIIVPVGPQHPPDDKENEDTSTTAPRMQTPRGTEGLSKALTKASTQSGEKMNSEQRAKVKLPIGVVPIPRLFDAERNAVATENRKENRGVNTAEFFLEKDKTQLVGHEENILDPPRLPAIGRHNPDQSIARQENWGWQHKVPPGVQEVGEEPNNLEKIPELEDTGNHPIGDDVEYGQYEGGDYEKELQMKNNDPHIEEGEDEGEDEDDRMEYEGNNLKVDKHPE